MPPPDFVVQQLQTERSNKQLMLSKTEPTKTTKVRLSDRPTDRQTNTFRGFVDKQSNCMPNNEMKYK